MQLDLRGPINSSQLEPVQTTKFGHYLEGRRE